MKNYFRITKHFIHFQALRLKEKAGLIKPCNVSRKNLKLKPSEEIMFLIWNLPAVLTCPFRTKECEKNCYAKKAETGVYPGVLESRKRNWKESIQEDFTERMIYTILKALDLDHGKRKIIVIIHESGDFYNREYMYKWLSVAEYFKSENVTFICYTKSFPYFDGVSLPKNFILRASIWSDTKPEYMETITKNNWLIYTAVEHFTKHDNFTQCRCSDCATCKKCWNKKYKDIRCEIH